MVGNKYSKITKDIGMGVHTATLMGCGHFAKLGDKVLGTVRDGTQKEWTHPMYDLLHLGDIMAEESSRGGCNWSLSG